MASEEVDKVIQRLVGIAHPHVIDPDDLTMMATDIEYKLKRGWTAQEIGDYMKSMEEVNPDLDEDIALARMKRVHDAVRARLGDAYKE